MAHPLSALDPNASSIPGGSPADRNRKPKIWIDLDNTPHVPFFEPVIAELQFRGFPLLVTARDAFQVCQLADKMGVSYLAVGKHYGKSRVRKVAGLAYRAIQLAPIIFRERPVLGVSHGARSQLLLSTLMRMPTILLQDYEHCRFPIMMKPTWVMAPGVMKGTISPTEVQSVRWYTGIKEDVYAWKLSPDPLLLQELGIVESDIIVTVRPPATEAHYHNPESEWLFERFMEHALHIPAVRLVLLPRNAAQSTLIRKNWPQWFTNRKTIIPQAALDGLNLIWHSDLVVSGGGTMNREAAALGVPVYSIFRGSLGSVDRHLVSEGRLTMVKTEQDVVDKIRLEKRERRPLTATTSRQSLLEVVNAIEEIANMHV